MKISRDSRNPYTSFGRRRARRIQNPQQPDDRPAPKKAEV